ncbi:MAG: RagB/SusD family nutrient uptake outer membrane protein [Prevotella sp.]|nr:RagB/SusD family nutrient uptake outer membrane protein [Prevotella sp.]
MKRIHYYIVCAICAICGLSSCSDFLEIEPQNEIILEKFWNEKADVDAIVAGCYSGLQSEAVIKRMMVWGEFRSDNIGPGSNVTSDGSLEKLLKENIDAKNGYTDWSGFYQVINRCNTVIKYAPGVAADDPAYTESELQANIAEMVGLRSLCYFYLIRAFRDVPFSREAFTDDDQKMDLPATKFDAVLDSLIDDLESVKNYAVKRYPVTKELYQTGRVTQDFIHALLCELYLWKKDYQNCVRYADLVIDSKKAIAEENRKQRNSSTIMQNNDIEEKFNGFPLVSNSTSSGYFGDAYEILFGRDRGNQDEVNQEIIFQLIFDDNTGDNGGGIANGAVNTFYGNSNATIGLVAPTDYIYSQIDNSGQDRKVYAYRNKMLDSRIYTNCVYSGSTTSSSNNAIHKFTTSSIEIEVTSGSTPSATYSSRYTQNRNGSNWIIYRLTDIMLLKAEALTQMVSDGSDAEPSESSKVLLDRAFTLVNAVNKRALCQSQLVDTLRRADYSSKADMENLVLQERQRELMFEGKRWFDLVRLSQRVGNTQVLASAALQKATTGAGLISNHLAKMDAIYWPYNLDEMKVNLNLVQNPAFGSGEDESYQKTTKK